MMDFYTNVALSKNDVLLRGYKDGKRVHEKVPYKPYLFVPTKKESKFTTLTGSPVGKVDFDTIREARDFIKDYDSIEGMPIYGLTNYQYVFLYDYYKGEIQYDPSMVSVVSLDIEVSIAGGKGFPDIQLANNEVTLITISRNGFKSVFGCGDFINTNPDVKYYKCKNEADLLRCFLSVWNSHEYNPDVVTGWNIEFFDVPYLVNRISKVLGAKEASKLSPWGFLQENTVELMGKQYQVYVPVGVSVLDYLQLYKKFGYTQQESYTLDHIASEELGETKLKFEGTLGELEVNDWQKYTEYNIRDVEIVDKLEDKLKLIELAMAMAYDAKVNYQDTFTTVRMWDVLIHNHLMDQNIVIPQAKFPEHDRNIVGGYVKDPQTGGHNWVVSLDLNSLYPHIMMQYNISPEVYLDKFPTPFSIDDLLNGFLNDKHSFLVKNDITVTANMCMFSRSKQGFLPAIMQRLYNGRTVYKNRMIDAKKQYELEIDKLSKTGIQLSKDIARYNNLQMAKKIQLNSGYGALANKWNRWYATDFAEAITTSGQLATRWIENKLNEYLNKIMKTNNVDYVIACDTDSVYIKLDALIDQLFTKEQQKNKHKIVAKIDQMCTEMFEPYIDQCYQELADYVNAFDQKMKMKRECIADRGIWTGKKHYILNVYNQEGVVYEKPKLKMMGIEAIRTSTPGVVRKAIKHALEVIMTKEETDLQDYIKQFKHDFTNMSFEEIAFPRSVNGLVEYRDSSNIYRKGTPIGVKGALIYNNLLKKYNIDKTYESIGDGQKIKFAYCKVPNPQGCEVLAAPGALPVEFKMDEYIDKFKQFDKAFLKPITSITSVIGWETEKRFTLDQFF